MTKPASQLRQMPSHFGLRSQNVIFEGVMRAACVEVKAQKIIAIHPYHVQLSCACNELGDLVLMPGLVDSHVHINEPGRTEWEGFITATQAAAAGGISTLVDMPLNCIPVTTSKAALLEKLAAVQDKLWVDCGFWGGVIPDNLVQLEDLLNAGVLGVKSFMIDSGIAEFPAVDAQTIGYALPVLAKHQVPYLLHAELDQQDLPPASIGDNYQSFLASRPKQWENDAVQLMVDLAHKAQQNGHHSKVHIVHLSSAEALQSIADAKASGLQFSAETCPHYLTIEAEQIPNGKTLFKCCPPIREHDNKERLWQAVKQGLISFIVSDHSPCTPQLKNIDSGDIEHAWGGISSLQFGLSLIWTEAKPRGFSLVDIARLMAQAPAEFAGLASIKGQIAVGMDADFCVFDATASYQISTEQIKYKHKISPYVGRTVQGVVQATYVRGQLVYQADKFSPQPFGKPLLKGQF
jgi:allantoinase